MSQENFKKPLGLNADQLARRLSERLEADTLRFHRATQDGLPGAVYGKIVDTIGLLNAIASGTLKTGNPRITTNLLDVLTYLDEAGFSPPNNDSTPGIAFSLTCRETIQQTAESGITIEGFEFDRGRERR